jgi:Tfp pilus assembly protein PilF
LAHTNLGLALEDQGKLDEAITEHHKAIALKPDCALAYLNLGKALGQQGKLGPAITASRKAVELQPGLWEAHANLGTALCFLGKLAEGITAYRKAITLVPPDHSRRELVSRQLKRCERLLALDKKLSAVLKGKAKPADAAEGLELAWLCQQPYKRFYAAAARLYADAFAAQPRPADNLGTGRRYNAACAAALAGIGEGKDAISLTEMERNRLRRQAVHWLRADLEQHERALENATPGARRATAQALQHWLCDPDLRGLRDGAHLKKLPPDERDACVKLWRKVREMLRRAQSNK